jgi:hypothetical protein
MYYAGVASFFAPSYRRVRLRASIAVRLGMLALLGLLALPAQAAPIPINNPSFEILPSGGLTNGCGAGCSYAEDFIPGWINIPFLGLGLSSGQWRPGTDIGNTTYFDALSDGPTSAYCSNGSIEQTVTVTVQAGLTYTLTADVGWRKDAGPTGLPRIEVNGVFYNAVAAPAVFGGWVPFTATYVARSEDIGSPITIHLSSVSFQGNFDNVRFSDSTSGSNGAGRMLGDYGLPGPPLSVTRAGSDLDLAWAGACSGATDYAIYEGQLELPRSKLPVQCSTSGATNARITPSPGARFYLVVPRTASAEGSYGLTSDAQERPPDAGACLAQSIASCP